MDRPIVYCAGPYTLPDLITNTQNAVLIGERLWELGFLSYIPLLSMMAHVISPHEYEYWLANGLEWVARSDVLYRLPGMSPGADKEAIYAEQLGIPVFYDIVTLNSWRIASWTSAK